jgi:diguanylate cyclase (GGDEF)-like protein/PAS domain S-box-containing protein
MSDMKASAGLSVPLRDSLKTQVTVVALAVFAVSIWSLSFYLSRSLQGDMERLLGEQQFSVVTAVAKEVNDNLTERQQALEAIARQMDERLLGNPQALQTLLEQRPLLELLFNGGVWVAGPDGTVIADLPRSANRLGVNYMDRDFVVAALRGGQPAIGQAVMGKQLKSPVFPMSTPVRNGQGQLIGVIVGVTDLGKPSFLDKVTQNSYGSTGGYVLVSPEARQIITATDKRRIMEVLPREGVNAFVDRNIAGYEGYSLLVNALGEEQLGSVKRVPAAGWYILLGSPAAEVFAPLNDQRQRLMWATLMFTLLTGGLTWLVLRRQLAPVVETAHAMAALADSAMLPKPLPNTYKGEVGQLVAGFNRMLQTWAQREESLKASESFKDGILNSLNAEIAVVDRQGVIKAVNARWQQFSVGDSANSDPAAQNTGVGASYLAACGANTDASTDGGQTIASGIQAVLDGRLPRFTCEYPCDSPTQQRWFDMIAMPLGEKGYGGAVISHTDITPRKQAEQAMQRLQTMMERTESMAHLASFQWEVDTNSTTWSPELFRFFNLDPALGTPDLEGQARLYTSASLKLLYDAVDKALTHGMPYELELTAIRSDGEERPCIVKAFPQRDGNGRVVHILGLVQDTTEIRRKDEQLRLAASVFTHAREGITITNAEGIILNVNDAFTRITGYSREEAIGQNPRVLKSDRQDAAFYAAMWRGLTEAGHWSGEIWNRRKNGVVYPELLTISAVRDERGDTRHYMALFADITSIKAHQSQLEHIAHFDALTHLPNRLLLADRLQQAMAQTQRRGTQLAVVYLDLDGFKNVNDQHGHDAGDQLLIALATAMKDTLREGDTLARIGGDEFVAVLIDIDGIESCKHMLTRLLGAASSHVNLGAVTVRCSASLGATFYPQAQHTEPDQLLRQADQAMYQAKMAGKNRYQFFDVA